MWRETAATILGFSGDGITFLGALLLALREWGEEGREKEIRSNERHLRLLEEPPPEEQNTTESYIEIDDEPVNAHDVRFVVLHRATKTAFWGAVLLTIGFCLLFLSRTFEHWETIKNWIIWYHRD
ncbi:MAG TPA: hypothetical protein VN658_04155 [Candidatus Acidoferrales bacterium]|nr:hypothetical protein [Candidatus Acidoferrales bacterium]